MTIKEALLTGSHQLSQVKIDSAFLDVELLLAQIIKQPRAYLLAHNEQELTPQQLKLYQILLNKRQRYEPLAYLLGFKEFYGLDFLVNKNVLIPRPESELIIDNLLEQLSPIVISDNKKTKKETKKTKEKIMLLDLGTGSGCLIITLAKTLNKLLSFKKNPTIFSHWAIDLSKPALKVAQTNALKHGQKKINFLAGNLLSPFLTDKKNKLQQDLANCQELIIMANLPYLDKTWRKSLKNPASAGLKYEPPKALDGGTDGLKYYRLLAKQIKQLRKTLDLPITIYAEIYKNQAKALAKLFPKTIFPKVVCQTKNDLASLDRLVIIKL